MFRNVQQMIGPSKSDNIVRWGQGRTNAKSKSVQSYNSDFIGNIYSGSSFQGWAEALRLVPTANPWMISYLMH